MIEPVKHHPMLGSLTPIGVVLALALQTAQLLGFLGGAAGEYRDFRRDFVNQAEWTKNEVTRLWAELSDRRLQGPAIIRQEQQIATLERQRIEDHDAMLREAAQLRADIAGARGELFGLRQEFREVLRQPNRR